MIKSTFWATQDENRCLFPFYRTHSERKHDS